MKARKAKRPSGAQNRKAKAARMEAELVKAGVLRKDYTARLGAVPLHDVSELVSWLCKAGGLLAEEALAIPNAAERYKTVGNLLAKVGLLSSKGQFAARVENIERRLAEIQQPLVSAVPQEPAEAPEPPLVVPARGTPLWRAWEARGALPPDGANVVEAPETSRAYRQLAAKEPA